MSAIEPMFRIAIPKSLGSAGKSHRTDDGADKILIVQQTYKDKVNQESIRDLCALFSREAGIRLITVEGSDAEIPPSSSASVEHLMFHTPDQVSAGVLAFQNEGTAKVAVRGVDDLGLLRMSYEEMRQLQHVAPSRERVFNVARRVLDRARRNHYPDALRKVRAAEILNKNETAAYDIHRRLQWIGETAGEWGVDLGSYPAVHRLYQYSVWTKGKSERINYLTAGLQGRTFAKRLLAYLSSFYVKVGGGARIDLDEANLEKIRKMIRFYARSTGLPKEELEARLSRHTRWAEYQKELVDLIGDACEWYKEKIHTGIQRMTIKDSEGLASSAEVFDEWFCMALYLGVVYFDLKEFRKEVVKFREASQLGDSMDVLEVQVQSCLQAVVNRMGPEAKRLFALELELQALYHALRALTTPRESALLHVAPGDLSAAFEELCALAGLPWPGEFHTVRQDLAAAEGKLTNAQNLLVHSLQRGHRMVERTLKWMHDSHHDRAILVAGGFHSVAASQILEDDHPEVSWVILEPPVGSLDDTVLSA